MVEEEINPVSLLAQEYKEDLDKIKIIKNIVIITDMDIKKLKSYLIKYNIEAKVDRNNFYATAGIIERIILKKLEKFAIEDVLERVREEDITKKPRKRKIDRQQIPKSLE